MIYIISSPGFRILKQVTMRNVLSYNVSVDTEDYFFLYKSLFDV